MGMLSKLQDKFLMTNIGTDCADESVERVLLGKDKRN